MTSTDDDSFSELGSRGPGLARPGSAFSAPLGGLRSGRLVFACAVQGLELSAGAPPRLLLQARFGRDVPHVSLQDGVATVRYERLLRRDRPGGWGRPAAVFQLNGSIRWEIEFLGGLAHLQADLSRLQLRSLDILGGASRLRLRLARPAGTAFIYIAGGVSQSTIELPPDTGVRVQPGGGSDKFLFDGKRIRAMGADGRVESPGYESAASRYDVCIAGGATHLKIERKG